jgi:transglutaminase-like putative cysteine protease
MNAYLKDTAFLDFNDPKFDEFTKNIDASGSATETALQLYYLIRDAFLYDPYHLDLTHEGLKASNVLQKKRAWCVEKSSVMAAAARKFNIPSRLGYAIVTNHIGADKLLHYLQRDEIVFHGFVELYLNGKWIKCTPAFDQRICRVSGVSPLDWDGKHDSLFQEFDQGKKFMEYKHFYGVFDDLPIELMNAEMKKYYPHLFESEYNSREFSFKHL